MTRRKFLTFAPENSPKLPKRHFFHELLDLGRGFPDLIGERVQKLRDILKTTKSDQKRIYAIKVDLLYLKYRENLTGRRYTYKDSKFKIEFSIRAINLTYFSRITVIGKSKSNSQPP